MKKLFIAVLAVAALASCAQDEIISKNQTAIAFGDAFVNNSTKTLYEGTGVNEHKVKAFKVWGTVTGADNTAVALYEGANVTRGDEQGYGVAWTCDVTRFWTPNCDYKFYAVVDANEVNATNGVPTSIEYTATGENDLLYGTKTKTTKTADGLPEDGALVAFDMQHLLSRIQFTFANGVNLAAGDKGEYSFKVTSLSVKTWKEGIYTVGADTPWAQVDSTLTPITFAATEEKPYVTGTASEGKVIIPGAQELLISYTYEVYFDNDKSTAGDAKKIYTGTVADKALSHNFEVNHSYNITATLKAGNAIEFTIASVKVWEPGDNPTTIQ